MEKLRVEKTTIGDLNIGDIFYFESDSFSHPYVNCGKNLIQEVTGSKRIVVGYISCSVWKLIDKDAIDMFKFIS